MKKILFLLSALITTFLSGCNKVTKNHVIIIAGQSNAAGCSNLFNLKDYSEKVYDSSKEGYENILLSSFCDFHTESSNFERKITQLEEYNGFGPEVGIAHKLSKTSKNEKYYLLKAAWGGTSINSNWLNEGKRAYHYNISIEYLKSKLEELKANNVSIDSLTICWMQGESDGAVKEFADKYKENEKALFTYFREDLSIYCSKIGIVDAFVSTLRGNPYAKVVNDAKLKVSKELKDIKIIRTNGENLGALKLTFDEGEYSHYDSESMYKLGVKFAKKAKRLF